MTYATIGRRAQRLSQLAFLRLVGRGLAYQLEAPTLWDVDFRTAVAQAELEDREQPGAYHRIRFAKPDGGFVEIDTTRPELIPACVALVAHPDDPRYQPLFGSEVVTPLFGVRVPLRAHALADPEKGTGVAMICTFGDITDVVWWRELGLPVRAVIQANGTFKPITWGEAVMECDRSRPRAAGVRPARRALGRQGPRAHGRAPSRERRPPRRAAADHARRQVLREGRPPARDRDQPPVVHQDDGRARGAPRPRPRARMAPALHAGAARELDQRARRRLVHQPPALLRRAVPGLVSRARGRVRRPRRPAPAFRRSPADRSVDRRPRRLHRRPARSARRVLWRSRHHGHVGDLVAVAADRRRVDRGSGSLRARVSDGRPPSGARHHQDVAVLDDAAGGVRARVAAVEERGDLRLGARPGSQEDVEVEGQRRHAAGAARGARVRRRALLGGERPARRGHGVRLGADEGRPPPRDQAAQRVEVRAVALRQGSGRP